jgi:hypothetical protein
MNKAIEIHEFSTGIVVETNPDGSWFSRGFTGKYMNQTIEPIPYPIQEAISNREFAIAEGASRDTPALIGREVCDHNEYWSVVAVVTRARDESRSFSAYRYFCTEGKGNISKILRFLANNPLQFNPFDTKTIGHPHIVEKNQETNVPLDNFQDLLNEPKYPVIVPFDKPCNPIILNQIARELVQDSLVAWAYNVGAVEAPRSFYIIKPSDAKAEQIIRKSLSIQVGGNKPIFGEQKIKTAINALCKRNKIKPEYLQTLEDALANPDINDKFWLGIFEGQGLKQGQSQGLYNEEMIRLATLQAVIVPSTLPDFLRWMSKREGKKEDHYQTSLDFQKEILSKLTQNIDANNFSNIIEKGVKLIIPRLLEQPDLLEGVFWLLNLPKGLWGRIYQNKVIKDIENDLNLMSDYVNPKKSNEELEFKLMEDEEWRKIFDELKVFLKSSHPRPISKYQVWVELFSNLNNYKFAALFAHISYGEVPKSIFAKIHRFGFGSNFDHTIYKIKIQREVGNIEQLFLDLVKLLLKLKELGGKIMPVWLVAILVFVFGVGGFLSRSIIFKSELEKSANTFFENNVKSSSNLNLDKEKDVNAKIAKILKDKDKNAKLVVELIKCSELKEECQVNNPVDKQIKKAQNDDNFQKTAGTITYLITKLSGADTEKQKKLVEKLKKVLGDDKLNYAVLSDKKAQSDLVKNAWVYAIYLYQVKHSDQGIQPDGIINRGGKTEELLKKDLQK